MYGFERETNLAAVAASIAAKTGSERIPRLPAHYAVRKVALVGSFPPRRCGIATFTADVAKSLTAAQPALSCEVVAIQDANDVQRPEPIVRQIIRQDEESDYTLAARRLNESDVDVVCIQHEFGIFGGPSGQMLISFMNALHAPIVTTLHTVLERPSPEQERVMRAILRRSSRVIVMAERGAQILRRIYAVPAEKLVVIPHGAPDVPYRPPNRCKARFGYQDRLVMLTFGLLSPGKGIESVIEAMPEIVARNPTALYVVLGATHPHLMRREGEAYRHKLTQMATALGVSDHIEFVDAYVENQLLLEYLAAADIYVTPYLNEAQITSGTLAYAIALGKPVVSTPYWHAQEAVTPEIGALVPFGSAHAFAEKLSELLEDADLREERALNAYHAGRATIWKRSGERYLNTFNEALSEARPGERDKTSIARKPTLSAVKRMSDSCGIYQHGVFGVPDRAHGYCIDDVARALILIQWFRKAGFRDERLADLEVSYAAFINHAWNPEARRFRNFMSFERTWTEAAGSADSNGRAFWAIGETARGAKSTNVLNWAQHFSRVTAPAMQELSSIRAKAFCILGAAAILQSAGDHPEARALVEAFARDLNTMFEENTHPQWCWFENQLTYDNARLPQALIAAGDALQNRQMLKNGLEALEWLCFMQTAPAGHFRPIGNDGFAHRESPASAQFHQQPLEAAATIDACIAAWRCTKNANWIQHAASAYDWFFGGNDLGADLADEDGGCFDGLHAEGVNLNQGAESILSLQMASAALSIVERI